MIGDFNLSKVNLAEQMYTEDDDSTETRFFNLIEDLKLLKNVTLTTRCRDSQTPSHLECVFTNGEFLMENLSLLTLLGESDHALIAFNLINRSEPKRSTDNMRWNSKRLNLSSLQDNPHQVD